MPLDPETTMTLGMTFPVKDLRLSEAQLAQLDEDDLPLIAERMFSLLIGNAQTFHRNVQLAVHTLLQEKGEIRPTK